ncbi:hypothetical protein ACFX15_044744 [Malus domestica]
MASTLKVLEQCQVSPPKDSVPTTSLPLTFLDIPWLVLLQPVQRLYFYEFPHPSHHFTQTLLPSIKHTLSLTLQNFFPLSGNLTCPPPPSMPYIHYVANMSSVKFTITESAANFIHLIGNHPRHVQEFDHLVPHLPDFNNLDSNSSDTTTFLLPILALQATIFPNSGLCISIAYRHVVDGRTANHFMKCWASVYKSGGDLSCIHESPPIYDRDLIKTPKDYEPILFNQYIGLRSTWKNLDMAKSSSIFIDNFRTTFVLRRENIQSLKQLIMTQCKNCNEPTPMHLSKFVVTCGFVWVCLMKALHASETGVTSMKDDDLLRLGFAADIRSLFQNPVPITYFGNCLSACYVADKKREIMAECGIAKAVKALEAAIFELKNRDLEGLKRMVPFRGELVVAESSVAIAGSPKLGVYGTDFGWGRAKKVEVVHFVDSTVFSLAESRDEEDGIERFIYGGFGCCGAVVSASHGGWCDGFHSGDR